LIARRDSRSGIEDRGSSRADRCARIEAGEPWAHALDYWVGITDRESICAVLGARFWAVGFGSCSRVRGRLDSLVNI